jgi:hypothetical protein
VSILALLSATPAAAADQGMTVITWSKDNPLIVQGNGQSYTHVHSIIGDFTLKGWLDYDVGSVGGIRSWSAWAIIGTNYGIHQDVPGLKAYKVSKSYGLGSRPDSISKSIEFNIPYSVIEPYAVGMCNFRAAALRDQGKSDQQIFGQDQEVSFAIDMGAEVDATGAGSDNQIWEATDAFILPVRCARWTGAQVPQGSDDLADAFRVLSARLKLTEETTLGGTCRVKTATALRANRAGETIEYRFTHSSGKKSPVFKIKTEANRIAVINRSWDVPNEDGPETGWFRVEGVNVPFKTAQVFYDMDCRGASAGGLTLGG